MTVLPPQPVGGFERRFADLDDQSCEHLFAMLGRARDPPEHLLNKGAGPVALRGIDDPGDWRDP